MKLISALFCLMFLASFTERSAAQSEPATQKENHDDATTNQAQSLANVPKIDNAKPAPITTFSPDRKYSVTQDINEFREHTLVVKHGDKVVHEEPVGGYGGYEEINWSSDSRYLAFTQRGTKTSISLAVLSMRGEHPCQEVKIPDYELNILGRHQLIERGRCAFDEKVTWIDETHLQFITRGSLVDSISDPEYEPENWYQYRVGLELSDNHARLTLVEPVKKKN
jgi:hypothetical protein